MNNFDMSDICSFVDMVNLCSGHFAAFKISAINALLVSFQDQKIYQAFSLAAKNVAGVCSKACS